MNEEPKGSARVTYQNTRGVTYTLCSIPTKTGKTRLAACRSPLGTPLTAMPEGYEFAENINGLVSVRKARTSLITPDELQAVRRALMAEPGCAPYGVASDQDAIVIYEPSLWPADLEDLAGKFVGGTPNADLMARMDDFAAANAFFSPLLRFVLNDTTRRSFDVERRYFSGDGGWDTVLWDKPLELAARLAVHRLGPRGPKDTFFDWL